MGKGDTTALGALGIAADVGGHPEEAALLAGELVGCWNGDLLGDL
jgi:hypothetical protein